MKREALGRANCHDCDCIVEIFAQKTNGRFYYNCKRAEGGCTAHHRYDFDIDEIENLPGIKLPNSRIRIRDTENPPRTGDPTPEPTPSNVPDFGHGEIAPEPEPVTVTEPEPEPDQEEEEGSCGIGCF